HQTGPLPRAARPRAGRARAGRPGRTCARPAAGRRHPPRGDRAAGGREPLGARPGGSTRSDRRSSGDEDGGLDRFDLVEGGEDAGLDRFDLVEGDEDAVALAMSLRWRPAGVQVLNTHPNAAPTTPPAPVGQEFVPRRAAPPASPLPLTRVMRMTNLISFPSH